MITEALNQITRFSLSHINHVPTSAEVNPKRGSPRNPYESEGFDQVAGRRFAASETLPFDIPVAA
jgi:hypothetical protein